MSDSRVESIGAAVVSSGGNGLLPMIEGYKQKIKKYESLIEQNKARGLVLEGSLAEARQVLQTLENAAKEWGVNDLHEVVTEIKPADPSAGQVAERVKEVKEVLPKSEYRMRYDEGIYCVYREEGQTKFCQRRLTTKAQKATHLCAIHGQALKGATRKRATKAKK